MTFLSSVTVTSPSKVIAHPTSGAFWVYKNSASLECYQYNMRTGAGPTLGSSTTISGTLDDLIASTDGGSITYSKNGDTKIYWRTVSNCSMGTESSVTAPSKAASVIFSQSSSGSIVTVQEAGGTRIWKFTRATDGTLTLAGTYVGIPGGSPSSMTPDGSYLTFSTTASDISTLNLANMTTVQSTAPGASMNRFVALSETRGIGLRVSVTHRPFTIGTSGATAVGTDVDFGITDFNGGFAMLPTRTLFYSGDQNDGSVWVHRVQTAAPYVGTPTEVSVGGTPDSLALLQFYQRR